MIEYFNFYYFLYITFAIGLLTGLYFLLRNKSKRTATIVIFILFLSNFILHFLKLVFNYYQEWMPYAIRTVTPENICAVSVLVFPWFYLSKKNILKDYMFYLGIISGLGATFIPIDVIDCSPFEFETIRFYFSHVLLWVVPLLMVMLKLHTLDYKRIFKFPFLLYLTLCIILVNEVILTGAGFIHIRHLYSNEVRNSSMIFGPLVEVEFIGKLFTALTPKLFLTVPIGPNAGTPYYWPIVWLIIPSYVYFCITALLLSLPFEFRNIKNDLFKFGQKITKIWKKILHYNTANYTDNKTNNNVCKTAE
ncbi:MAG: hypothetical protein FWD28_01335 [Treponema sp.]|nr:hypothetical protein [Treponema sp.]